jgi:hypothetical protein
LDFRKIKKTLIGRIPLLAEGVARSAKVVSATHGKIFFEKTSAIGYQHYLGLFLLSQKKSTPSTKGEFCTAFDLNSLH